jgi:NADPH:quinone reductase-like Zn-dependent oxidoreductase
VWWNSTACAGAREEVWPLVGQGRIRHVVHPRMPLRDAAEFHKIVTERTRIGKVFLTAG